jgi:hypothetical protein
MGMQASKRRSESILLCLFNDSYYPAVMNPLVSVWMGNHTMVVEVWPILVWPVVGGGRPDTNEKKKKKTAPQKTKKKHKTSITVQYQPTQHEDIEPMLLINIVLFFF